MIGQTISHYKILAKLGEGGMGVVYKALDTKLNRSVALKFLPFDLTSEAEAIDRFINEAQAASALDHMNICTVHEISETEERQLYIVMACYEGETLQHQTDTKTLALENLIDIFIQIARGLECAHEAGIIHRDLKPSNLILTTRGEIKIIDFGLAKLAGQSSLTKSGRTLGTVAYMSPEQLSSASAADRRTDIWSFGVVMYELLTGHLPFQGEYEGTLIYAIVNESFLPLDRLRAGLPATLENIVHKCLAKSPDLRYQIIGDVVVDLMRARGELLPQTTAERSREGRTLSAIMFTDMVGYSALTQKNEELALALLAEHRRIVRSLFPQFGGNEVEAIGDAFFVEFTSALQAGRCAIEIQKRFFEYNRTAATGKQIKLRIGLHLGDVVHTGGYVHGDGVNIAARLEPLATPGGICLSEDVARQIQNKIDFPLRKLGRGELKNISTRMEIYRVMLPWERKTPPVLDIINFAWQRRKERWYRWGAFAFLILCIYLLLNQKQGDQLNQPTPLRNRIAVLPLGNISPDPRDEYFAEGLTEELIATLSKINQFKIIARNSVLRYKDGVKSASEIGEELQVGTLLVGSVRKADHALRISVQLVDATRQEPFWAQQYDRELNDIFVIQSDIARNVAEALRVNLLRSEQQRLETRPTENLEAYSHYLQGLFHWNKRTPSEIMQGITHFQKAIAADSTYAQPYAGLANAYIVLGTAEYAALPMQEAKTRARAAADKAVALDTQCAEAHGALANLLYTYEWDWKGAEREFASALALQSNYATVHHWYAHYLCSQGRLDEALVEIEKAQELDPLSLIVNTTMGMVFHYQRRPDQAVAQLHKTLEMDSNFVPALLQLGLVYVSQQRTDEAIATYERAVQIAGKNPVSLSLLAHAYGISGKRAEALQLLEQVRNPAWHRLFLASHMVLIYLGLGEKQLALDWLEQAYLERSNYLIYLKVEPLVDDLREEERFKALCRKVGLEAEI